MILRNLFSAFVALILCFHAFAHEGMWIPSTLSKLIMSDMESYGLKLSAEEIYSINNSSLKDAIVHFGGGCTASVISDEGLILTNHHCGYSQIQSHSSVESDYLKDGFWAMSKSKELPNQGLTATFVVRIENVTDKLRAVSENLEGQERIFAVEEEASRIISEATNNNHYKAEIKPFYYGNEYYMIVTETYSDVRLVGAPPSSIGKFGGDTDNWIWPRHTGDFSIFRIYADENNMPAEYSADNVPFQAKKHLEINVDGLSEGDFTMVFGFPGTTEQYLSSAAVSYITDVENPAKIAMREASLGVIDQAREQSSELRIAYAAKQSRISNAYKKWIGQSLGLERFNAVEKKKEDEESFMQAATRAGKPGLSNLISEFDELYQESSDYALARTYFIEFYYYGPEALRFAQRFKKLISEFDSLEARGELEKEIEVLKSGLEGYFKDYDPQTDQGIMAAQLPLFMAGAPTNLSSKTLRDYVNGVSSELAALGIYRESIMDDKYALEELLEKKPKKILKTVAKDPIYIISSDLVDSYVNEVRPGYAQFSDRHDALMSVYVKAQMDLFPTEKYFPDANSTLRLTFGKMEGSKPRDGMSYLPYTTLEGVMQKYLPGDKEFDLPEKLLELYRQKDFGAYAVDGELRVCFLGSNHTTGGNSGSPTLNARGELVGLNFDRTWESTMSDIMFNGEICRNIMVDMNYILFIIDKFAGAGHLVDEMSLVHNPAPEPEQVKDAEPAE